MDSTIIEASNVLQNMQATYGNVPAVAHHNTAHQRQRPMVNENLATVNSPDHARSMLQTFYHMYQEHIGCDFIIAVESSVDGSTSEFLVHKLVLNGASKFFKGIFDYHHGNRQVITGMKLNDVSNIIDFMYTGSLKLDKNNVWGMWTAASYLQIPSAMRLCEEFSKGTQTNAQPQAVPDKSLPPAPIPEELRSNPQAVFNLPITSRKTGKFDDVRLGRIVPNKPALAAQVTQLQDTYSNSTAAPAKQDELSTVDAKGLDLLATSASTLPNEPSGVENLVQAAWKAACGEDMSNVEDGYLSSGSAMDVSDFEEPSDDGEGNSKTAWSSTTHGNNVSEDTPEIPKQSLKITISKSKTSGLQENMSTENPTHSNVQSIEKRYSCPKCNKKFAYRAILKRHDRLAHRLWTVPYSSPLLYQTLVQGISVSAEHGVSCSVCLKKFNYYTEWKTHYLKSHTRLFKCVSCKTKYVSATQLRFHVLKTHKRPLLASKTCSVCPRVFLHEQNLVRHTKSAL